jgi:hypothetical protein|tara:strand:+ start:606 stop:806 length:201 start_codon:yes stop_codon:yes gene_type:complete
MISHQTEVGDLVYIPSQVLLTNYKTFIKTDKPVNVVCLGKKNVEVQVFYNGSSWWVNKEKVYNVRK